MCRLGAVGSNPQYTEIGPVRQLGAQGVEVRRVRDQAAPLEVVEDVLVHGRFPSSRLRPVCRSAGTATRLPYGRPARATAFRRTTSDDVTVAAAARRTR